MMTSVPEPQPGGGLLAHLAQMGGVTAESERAQLAADILGRARSARKHHDGHPNGAWSEGEKAAVALLLDDREWLTAEGYTLETAARRVTDGMYFPPDDFPAWLAGLRAQLDTDAR